MHLDLLPSSVPRETRNVVMRGAVPWVPIYCANCGCDGGHVPEDAKDFAFYLCIPCHDKHGTIAGTMAVPDEVFWQKVKDAQIEKYGRELLAHEVVEELKVGDSMLSKLAKERLDWKTATKG